MKPFNSLANFIATDVFAKSFGKGRDKNRKKEITALSATNLGSFLFFKGVWST